MYFLDTNICVHILNGKFPYLNKHYLECERSEIKIPSVVLFELYYGAEKSQQRERNFSKIRVFTSEVEIVPFDSQAAEVAGKIRARLESAGIPIGGNDLLIAAIARANNGILVTNNTREFSRVPDLSIEDWTK